MQIEIYWSLQLDVPDLDPFPLSHRPDLSLLFASLLHVLCVCLYEVYRVGRSIYSIQSGEAFLRDVNDSRPTRFKYVSRSTRLLRNLGQFGA